MKDVDQELRENIIVALHEAEESGDIVLVSPVLTNVAQTIANKTKEVYVGETFTHDELVFFRQLIAEAEYNDNMFCGELECTTGFNKKTINDLFKKLKELTSYY